MAVVIVGAGHGGVETAGALRRLGYDGTITVVDGDDAVPYERPPLSKRFLGGEEHLSLRGPSFFSDENIDLRLGTAVAAIDRQRRVVRLSDDAELAYEHLVLATGSRPRRLPVSGGEHAVSLHSLADATALRARLASARSLAIIGAGFIGMELAAHARTHELAVTVLELSDRPMDRVLSPTVSGYFEQLHREHGVDLRTSTGASEILDTGSGATVRTDVGDEVAADVVVAAVGAVPQISLATEAGLEVAAGVLVDEQLRTSDQQIYAIGDCAQYVHPLTGGQVRLEAVANATDQGTHVAGSICGASAPYSAVPWFYTDQYDARLRIAGIWRPGEQVVRGSLGSGTVFTFDGDTLVCAESINAPREHMACRKLVGTSEVLSATMATDPNVDLRELAKAAS
ncbi:FAD-dependent oxidoreductase [Epidermidibacterium keratini]|uniref:FAD-dependent oxidoreductase n=1 Tax=Epidermidibacterium keratini TaxID=1891644 RepID=A0A7L4YSK6_9ACTN|nr:FAD-dependent oxidoreductase [Epidermidibacterium keratini]QHC01953.1 FAD-dependent oxidoreductase [Epidermidibacterium keratini]